MSQGPRYRTGLHRHREGRTDHRHRLKLIKSGKPRAVVRRSLRDTRVQLVVYRADGDRVAAQATAGELSDHGWNGSGSNCPAAYLTGFLAGTRAADAGITDAVLDIGDHAPSPGSNIFAALRGLIDAGVDVPHGDQVLPSARRLRGEHIDDGTPDEFDRVLEALGGDPVGVRAEAEQEPAPGAPGDEEGEGGEAPEPEEATADAPADDEAGSDEDPSTAPEPPSDEEE